jgi:mono/diheme cytochrome c family protein
MTILSLLGLIATVSVAALRVSADHDRVSPVPVADEDLAAMVERGHYLVRTSGCHDCHTPWKLGSNGPEPDMERMLSGHPADLELPPPPKSEGPWLWHGAATNTAFAGPWGISYTANLTSDELTGIGAWTEDIFVRAIRTGRHWGQSRPILPPMPWAVYAQMTDRDLASIFAYLRTVRPIRNQVPEPVIAALAPAP